MAILPSFALRAAYQARKSNAGNAQSATQKRDEVLKTLDRWVSDFKNSPGGFAGRPSTAGSAGYHCTLSAVMNIFSRQ